jgi:Flp pilus assembly pilin Flp
VGIGRRAAAADIPDMISVTRLRREDGQTMAEYGTILTVITIACLTAIALLAAASTSAITRVGALFGG